MSQKHAEAIRQAYNDVYQEIAHDLTAPGATMHRDELFPVCSDMLFRAEIPEDALAWWNGLTPGDRVLLSSAVLPDEYYEVGDNSGFGPDGTMYP